MQIIKKFRDTFLALLPIMAIVLLVHFFFCPFETDVLIRFFVSIALICVGEVFFLTGVDSTIMPMGDMMVGSVNKASKFFIFILFAGVFGVFATIAEPDVTIFSEQVILSGIHISKTLLVFFIGAGVGIFVAFGVVRIVKNIELKYVYIVIFAIIFLLATQVKSEYIAIAFDAGGATTGIITAPFLLSIASGISTKFTRNSDNKEVFGMIGLASLGPVVAVLLFFIMFGNKVDSGVISTETVSLFLQVLGNSVLAILPLAIIFYLYDLILIKLPMKRKLRFLIGISITFVGLFLFLYGIELGLTEMGSKIGEFVSSLSVPWIMVFCVVLGFIITFTEPSVIVLSKRVQVATKGNIPYKVVMITIAISMAFAIVLAALKILFGLNFFYIILIGYIIALVLMFFVPEIFTGLAFDSGGVASGPMTSAFILPIMISLASLTASSVDGFGLIGIVSMCPIIVLQIFGLVYKFLLVGQNKKDHKRAINLSYSSDMYSNIEQLEIEHKKLMEGKLHEKQER